jgi:hypothetical protein
MAVSSTFPVYIVLGILALVAVIVVLALRAEKKRREALRQLAMTRGYTFKEKDPAFSPGKFKIFNKGYGRKLYNILQKDEFTIFDYQYTVGGGRSSHTYSQTVALVSLKGVKLPQFVLYPEHIFHKIGNAFGYKDIDFDSNPVFSKKYFLKGENEGAIRGLFKVDVLNYFENTNFRGTIEAEGDKLIYYRTSRRVKPADIDTFVNEAKKIVELFK